MSFELNLQESVKAVMTNVLGGCAVVVTGLASVTAVLPLYAQPVGIAINEVPAHKQFALHHYISSQEATALLEVDPDILFIDVRDTAEVDASGRPQQVDAIVPVHVQIDVFDETLQEHILAPNPDFLDQMAVLVSAKGKNRDSLIILTCGSGFRSAIAASILADAGYTNVWHIPEGHTGDETNGLDGQNAWQLAGLAWTDEPFDDSLQAQLIKH